MSYALPSLRFAIHRKPRGIEQPDSHPEQGDVSYETDDVLALSAGTDGDGKAAAARWIGPDHHGSEGDREDQECTECRKQDPPTSLLRDEHDAEADFPSGQRGNTNHARAIPKGAVTD